MAAVLGVIVVLAIVGFTIDYWYVVVPTIVAIGLIWFVWHHLDQRKLSSMTAEQRADELRLRQERKAERSRKWSEWMSQQQENEAGRKRDQLATAKRVRQDISKVGDKSSGTLARPRCGGTSFKAKRSRGAKVALGVTVGVGALLAPKTRVKCVTCGTEYLRG